MKEPSRWKASWIRLPTAALTTTAAIPSPTVPSCFRTIALTSTKIANHRISAYFGAHESRLAGRRFPWSSCWIVLSGQNKQVPTITFGNELLLQDRQTPLR